MQFWLLKKKYLKNLSIIFFSTLMFLIVFELLSRALVFFVTKNNVIFKYGFNKTIIFKVKDLSELEFILFSKKKENTKNKKKTLVKPKTKLIIWIFGGSTTEGNTPACGHETSNWPNELAHLNENISVVNFGNAGKSTLDANRFLIRALNEWNITSKNLKDSERGKPDIILWANKINEWNNFEDKNRILSKNNSIKFLQKIDLTLKLNSLFYFLFNDMVERINYKLFGHNPYEYIERSPENFNSSTELEMSAQIYEERTVRAINYAKNFDIDFHIISLFGRYGHGIWRENYGSTSDSFYHVKFYDYWFKIAEKISKQQNVYFFKAEEVALTTIKANNKKKSNNRKVFFCDEIHQTLEGNILTASIINDYLMKIYNYENN